MSGYVEMPDCIQIKRKKERVCIAGMNHRIDVFVRSIQPITKDEVDFGEAFTNKITVWALLDTKRGIQFFDKVNIEQTTTHRFIFRFIPDVTFERFITFKGIRYRVMNCENLQEEDTFHQWDCIARGDDTLPATEV